MDSQIADLIAQEEARQAHTLMLIPSENYASHQVLSALGSVFANKYAEGYPRKRYYEGNEIADQVESLAITRAKELFGVPHVNVQPYSGSPANAEILFALCEPGDTIMGLSLSSGGHLTHGHPKVTFSGRYYRSVQFGLRADARIDYDAMQHLVTAEQPKVIILGTTAYPFGLDFARARQIADSVGAYLVADISHIVGLVIGKQHQSPVPYAHVIMSTTHKMLRGPRGAMILVTDEGLKKNPDLAKQIDMAVFPGLQGGPHLNQVAALAVALSEAATPAYQAYTQAIVDNATALAEALMREGIQLVGNGTENHLMILDFSAQGTGKGTLIAYAMGKAGLIANKNTVPQDRSPFYPSGVRIGTPAVTTRGMGREEMRVIASHIATIVSHLEHEQFPADKEARAAYLRAFRSRIDQDPVITSLARDVAALCERFPQP